MNRGPLYIGMMLAGWVGWWAGGCIGLGLMGCFLVSTVASFAGLFLAWWLMEEFLG